MFSTTTGLILLNEVELVKEKLGENGVAELKKQFGDINFSAFGFYPETLEAKLISVIAEIIYGKDNDESQYQIGYFNFKQFAKHLLGKAVQITITLFGRDMRKLFSNFKLILEGYVKGTNLEVEFSGNNQGKIIFRDLPFNPNLY